MKVDVGGRGGENGVFMRLVDVVMVVIDVVMVWVM